MNSAVPQSLPQIFSSSDHKVSLPVLLYTFPPRLKNSLVSALLHSCTRACCCFPSTTLQPNGCKHPTFPGRLNSKSIIETGREERKRKEILLLLPVCLPLASLPEVAICRSYFEALFPGTLVPDILLHIARETSPEPQEATSANGDTASEASKPKPNLFFNAFLKHGPLPSPSTFFFESGLIPSKILCLSLRQQKIHRLYLCSPRS